MWKIVFIAFATAFAVRMGDTVGAPQVHLGGLVGAPQDTNPNDDMAQQALNFAVDEHNRRTNDLYLSRVSRVISLKSQVVAGIKYFFTVEMGKTPCRKNQETGTCAINKNPKRAQLYQCMFTVWSRPWMPDIQVLKEEC
nr:cystatin-like [Monopterus albus]